MLLCICGSPLRGRVPMKINLPSVFLSGAVLAFLVPHSAAALCPLSQVNPSVTVCTPAPNALVQSMVHLVAGSTDSNPVTSMQIFVDGTLTQTFKGTTTVDTFVALAVGYHTITVKGWDKN